MGQHIDLDNLMPAEQIVGEDAEDTGLLREMFAEAARFLSSFEWCPEVDQAYFGGGVGGVVAVFLFRFGEKVQGTDECLWVIEGDLPSAYLVTDQAKRPAEALQVYSELMEDWAKAVMEGKSLEDVYPVRAEPTVENARDLLKRIEFIRQKLLPQWRGATRT